MSLSLSISLSIYICIYIYIHIYMQIIWLGVDRACGGDAPAAAADLHLSGKAAAAAGI